MRSFLINSLIYNRVIIKRISKIFETTGLQLEILAIVDSVVNSKKTELYCTVTALRAHIPASVGEKELYRAVKGLIGKGYLEQAGMRKKKYELVLTGSGDYILREYSKMIHEAIRLDQGKQSKRLKYSFFNEND